MAACNKNYEVCMNFNKILPDYFYILWKYYRRLGSIPNLGNPKKFSELLQIKKLKDRNSIVMITSDKYLSRYYINNKFGKKYLTNLYFVGNCFEKINFDDLPDSFVIKITHGAGYNIIVYNKKNINLNELRDSINNWMRENYFWVAREWAYKYLCPFIMIEELLIDNAGMIPKDYKFFVFKGNVRLIQVDAGRFDEHTQSFYNENWVRLNISFNVANQSRENVEKPVLLKEMISIAEKIGADFDIVRVDLYLLDERIVIGEITHYHLGGFSKTSPKDFDVELGSVFAKNRPIKEKYFLNK